MAIGLFSSILCGAESEVNFIKPPIKSEVEVNFAKTQTNTVDRTLSQFKGKTKYTTDTDEYILKGIYEQESGDKHSTMYNLSALNEHYFGDRSGVYGKFTIFKDTNRYLNQSEKYNVGMLYKYNSNFKARIGYEIQDKSYFTQDSTEQYIKIGFIGSYKALEAILDRNVRVSKGGSNSTELDLSTKLYEDKGLFVKFSCNYYKEDKPILAQSKSDLKTLIGVGYEF